MTMACRFHDVSRREPSPPSSGVRRRNALVNERMSVRVGSESLQGRNFHARRLRAGSALLVFHEDLAVETRPDESGWTCSIEELQASARGAKESGALAALAGALREEASRLLHTPSHELDAAERERKGLLLGSIDVIASKIAEPLGEHTWVLGHVEVDADGHRWFQAVSSLDGRHTFAPEMAGGIPDDGFLRMAKVCAGEAGEPVGPVVELGPARKGDAEQLWAEWQDLADADD